MADKIIGAIEIEAGTGEVLRSVLNGTIARLAIQCTDPRSGKTGTWLFTGDNHKDASSAVSPLLADCYAVAQWAKVNNWQSVGSGYVFNYESKISTQD